MTRKRMKRKKLKGIAVLVIAVTIIIIAVNKYSNNSKKAEDSAAVMNKNMETTVQKNISNENLSISSGNKEKKEGDSKKDSDKESKNNQLESQQEDIKNSEPNQVKPKNNDVKLENNEEKKENAEVKEAKITDANLKPEKNDIKPENNKKVDNQTFFSNSVFFGDSVTESFSFYEFLDESNVAGYIGLSLLKSHTKIDSVVKNNPKNVFIMLGNNDIEGGISKKVFINTYVNLIHKLKEKLPEANIYIQSVFPVKEKAEKKYLTNSRISEYNNAIKEMTVKENVKYINVIPALNNSDKDYYEPDGIHVVYDFYPVWLDYLRNNYEIES